MDNFNQFDANNMLGAMLARSMRVAHGDPFGGAVRQALPTFQDRYNLYRQRDIDRLGGEAAAYQQAKNWLPQGADEAALRAKVEDMWRQRADTDMRNYDLQNARALRSQMNKPSWIYY